MAKLDRFSLTRILHGHRGTGPIFPLAAGAYGKSSRTGSLRAGLCGGPSRPHQTITAASPLRSTPGIDATINTSAIGTTISSSAQVPITETAGGSGATGVILVCPVGIVGRGSRFPVCSLAPPKPAESPAAGQSRSVASRPLSLARSILSFTTLPVRRLAAGA